MLHKKDLCELCYDYYVKTKITIQGVLFHNTIPRERESLLLLFYESNSGL
jgi:hypothetical protein